MLVFTTLAAAFSAGVMQNYLNQEGRTENLKRLLNQLPPTLTVPPGVTYGCKIIPDADHPWQPVQAGSGWRRGVCPGLNILANYGYISRNGTTTLTEVIYAQMEALGLGLDLAGLLAILGVGLCGDPISQKFSIGDPDPSVPGCGLNYCHNSFEIDMSMSRDDAYFHNGNGTVFNSTRWGMMKQIADTTSNGTWNVPAVTKMRDYQFEFSVANNPQFTRGVMGVAFDPAQNFVNLIIPSADENGNVLPAQYSYVAQFFGISNAPDGTYILDIGSGILPPSPDGYWHRQAIPVTIPTFALAGAQTFAGGSPTIHLPGANTGTTNSYVPALQQPQNITPEGLICFLLTYAPRQLPCPDNNLLVNTILWITSALVPTFDYYQCVAT